MRARDAEASVRLLERRLDSARVGLRARDVRARGLVVDRRAELHVVSDRLGRGSVASVHERQHGRGERRALRRVLGGLVAELVVDAAGLADLPRVAERALHERHRHDADDLVDDRTHAGARALMQQVTALGEQAAGLEERI
eukprot:scaffold49315_cov67-Phaeocystis_antarctica.AAC.1